MLATLESDDCAGSFNDWVFQLDLFCALDNAFALRKSWQERYTDWRDAREEVVIMGPDKFSSWTTTSYYVKSLKTGKFFYTDDVVQPPADAPTDVPGEQAPIYLQGRAW